MNIDNHPAFAALSPEARGVIARNRLEEIRAELRAERISMGELIELQNMTAHIHPSDVELLEAAGVPEYGYFSVDVWNDTLHVYVESCRFAEVTEAREHWRVLTERGVDCQVREEGAS
jgi:hypothetical protein